MPISKTSPVGALVRAYTVLGEERSAFDTKTRSEPWQLAGRGVRERSGQWVALIEGRVGGWSLDCLEYREQSDPEMRDVIERHRGGCG